MRSSCSLRLATGQLQSCRLGILVSTKVRAYFTSQPPLSGTLATVITSAFTATYETRMPYGLDYTVANSGGAATAMGFVSGSLFPGSVLVSDAIVSATALINLDVGSHVIYILSAAYAVVATVTLSRTAFNGVVDLVALIKSTFLSRNISIDVAYKRDWERLFFHR